MAKGDAFLTPEFYANLDAIERAFPGYRLLNKNQMAEYLGFSSNTTRRLSLLGINSKLTRESFAMRLSALGKEGQR